MRRRGYALAYWLVSMFRAALEDGQARPTSVDSRRAGSVVTASEPMPLETFTTTGASERSSSGKKAWSTRTGPRTLVSYTRRRSSAVVSATGRRPPVMPALLTSTSSDPCSAATAAAAAATESSSVTSSGTKRPPSASAAARPRSGSRAPIHTVWPAASRRRAVSRPSPLLAPVISVVVMPLSLMPRGRRDQGPAKPGTRRPMLAPEPQRHTRGVEADALAACPRSWRDRLSPGEAGLPVQARRRAPGLRRQELAQLAGLSVDYLTRLEQGRARHPSAQVVAALARALRLSDDEQAHLFRLAGHAAPGSGRMSRHLTPGIQRVLDRLDDVPVVVLDAAGRVV